MKEKDMSFLNAPQKEQKSRIVVSRGDFNIYILLLFERKFDGGESSAFSQNILLCLISEAPLLH